MQLTIKRINDRLEIKKSTFSPSVQTIPEAFIVYIDTIDRIECEFISFKSYINEQFYTIKLKKKLNEYIFDIIPIKDPRIDEDTDQLINRITTKYLVADETENFNLEEFDSEKKMILSILLEISKIESKLESLDKILEKRIEITENAFKSLEDTLEERFFEKKDLNLLGLLTNASKIDLVILFVILLSLVVVADTINVKGHIRDYLDDPTYLAD